MPRRAGSTLIELLAALPLLSVLGLLAISLLLAAYRGARTTDANQGMSRELRHAAVIAESELRPLRAEDVVAWSDSSLVFRSHVGVGIACDVRDRRNAVLLIPDSDSTPARAQWATNPAVGDEVELRLSPLDAASAPIPWRSSISAVGAESACVGHPLRRSRGSVVRLSLRDALPRAVAEGSVVLILRRVAYALYRGGDGLWYLGRRAFDGTRWDVIQPMIGPLMSYVQRGMRIAVRDSALSRVAAADQARLIELSLRAHPDSPALRADSILVRVALRGTQ